MFEILKAFINSNKAIWTLSIQRYLMIAVSKSGSSILYLTNCTKCSPSGYPFIFSVLALVGPLSIRILCAMLYVPRRVV